MFNTGDESKKVNSQLNSVLAATGAAALILDKELHIINYTPAVTTYIELSDSDFGRPFHELTPNFKYDKLADDVQEALQTKVPKELEVQLDAGKYVRMNITTYNNIESNVDGVVITFNDITENKNQKAAIEKNKPF
jgi:two-component system CheB/CheR fusion protein